MELNWFFGPPGILTWNWGSWAPVSLQITTVPVALWKKWRAERRRRRQSGGRIRQRRMKASDKEGSSPVHSPALPQHNPHPHSWSFDLLRANSTARVVMGQCLGGQLMPFWSFSAAAWWPYQTPPPTLHPPQVPWKDLRKGTVYPLLLWRRFL